MFPHVVSKQQA